MLTQQFSYKSFSRETINGTRYYSCPNKEKLPSVTSILSATKPKEARETLSNWKKRLGPIKSAEISAESSGRGTRLHKYLEQYVKNDIFKLIGTNPYSIQAYNMAKVIIEKGLINVNRYYGSEVDLYYPGLYGGATDVVAELNDETIFIGDFKNSMKHKKEEWVEDYKIQIVAYIEAHNKLFGTNIKRGIIMLATLDLEYQEFVVNESNIEKYRDMWWARVAEFYHI